MRRRTARALGAVSLVALVAALAWPAFAAVATALGTVSGEAWQLDAWDLEPKRRLLAFFIEGWILSAPFALGAGLLALLDFALLSRWRVTDPLAGITLPIAGAALAIALWPEPGDALPTLAATGFALAVVARLGRTILRRLA